MHEFIYSIENWIHATRLCLRTPPSGPRASGFSSGKDGEAGDVGSIVDTAGCSQTKNKPLEARWGFQTEPCKEDLNHALGLLRKSLENSRNVSDQTIARCFPRLGEFYRNELVKGMELYLEGAAENDTEKTAQGQRLMDAFRTHTQSISIDDVIPGEPAAKARAALSKVTL